MMRIGAARILGRSLTSCLKTNVLFNGAQKIPSGTADAEAARLHGVHLRRDYGSMHGHGADRGMLGTTVLCVRKGDKVVVIADGQVTMGNEIIKPNVRKVRRLGDNVIGGFAGATADAFTLFERLEAKLEEHPGQLTRAAVELAKAWRTDKFLRRLDAVMVVADADISLTITGNGDVLEPYDGVIGIGSGGSYASSAARALIDLPYMDAETIARKAMKIAADSCIYTNHNFVMEEIGINAAKNPRSETVSMSLSIPPATPAATPDEGGEKSEK
eukprot:TRINITY_DN1707_c0_g1_i1.p1 TRINITY_DN1707_c0_g1~~TRINITY_DN1707_c0_g1_i1.p1  ORF type:complete len:273 (-),score=58.07 TRINITY_DN1707_c0_g1_i1:302-1120(-)